MCFIQYREYILTPGIMLLIIIAIKSPIIINYEEKYQIELGKLLKRAS